MVRSGLLKGVLTLIVSTAVSVLFVAAQEGDFKDPGNLLPDASVSAEIVAKDISSLAGVGAGGIEYLPFYFYGLVYAQLIPVPEGPIEPPTDWSIYGFGDTAFNELFKETLKAIKDQGNGFNIDFALGPNQGAGVPSEPGTDGLSYEIVPGNATVTAGFSGPVPPPYLPPILQGGLGFQGQLEQFGQANLTAVFALKVTGQTTRPVFTYGVGEVAMPVFILDEDSYIDLTPNVSVNGQLEWTPPADGGNSTWKLFSYWQRYTNQRACRGGLNASTVIGNGSWTVDHFSTAGAVKVTDFWDQQILSDSETAELLTEVAKYSWEDSMEILAALYWTPDFISRFEQEMGYSIIKYLPLLYNPKNTWNGGINAYPELYQYGKYTTDNTSVHDLDYRTVLTSGYQDYLDHFKEWSHARGVEYSTQPSYNLPLEMLRNIPSVDAPEGESLGFEDSVTSYRQLAGPAHLAGRNVISSEMGAVSGPAFNLTIPQFLYHGKAGLAGGINQQVLHGAPYSGNYPNTTWPGYTTFYYLYSEMWTPNLPTYGSGHLKDTLDWFGRNQWVLQQGVPKMDLAVYYYAAPWAPGDEDAFGGVNGLGALGYTYDYLSPQNLLLPQAIVRDGVLAADGPSYKALIFSGQEVITLEAAQAVLDFAQAGLPIIVVGDASALPNQTYPSTDVDQLSNITAQIAHSPSVHFAASIGEISGILSGLSISPKAGLNCTSNPVYPVVRGDVNNSTEYVFLYNDQYIPADCSVSFTSAAGGNAVPFVYNAFTGAQEELVEYTTDGSVYTLPVNLAANETTILVFKSGSDTNSTNKPYVTSSSENVAFISRSNSSDTSVLATVTTSGSASITFDSGKTTTFDVSLPATLDLPTWDIEIEDWHAPEDRFDVEAGTAITLHNFTDQALVPWTQLGAGFESVSGVGRYTTRFTVPSLPSSNSSSSGPSSRIGALLSLGPVVNTIRASIDGVQLAPIDPARPVVDISGYVAEGQEHELQVEVTTTLFNRIKSVADQVQVWGQVASAQQSSYATQGPYEYGLLGPVTLEWAAIAEIDTGGL
ncbi:hypothetical protein KVR01_013130 [Diaporthe batatas]|uniref:uncharacterized protein n=1 Tax=Diaporthe batatas TaxID=748121 RepID=UPI001D049574|nr:uncharacterized protein KVR01_013130 [Diaporthe batatas]KAG8157140.1 hypothetical protein KVR01_013130 [Diaporthe batatas]